MDRKVETTIREIMASGCDNGIKPCHPLTHSEIQRCMTDKNIAPLVTRMANLFDTIHKFGDGQMDGDWYSRVTIAAAELELYMTEFHLLTLGIGPPDRLELFKEWLKDCEERPNEVLGWGVEPRTMTSHCRSPVSNLQYSTHLLH